MVEGLGVMLVLITFAGGFLLVGYLIFARAWLQFQGEQALYCVATRHPAYVCERRLRARVDEALPWGRLTVAYVNADADNWRMEMEWLLPATNTRLHLRKLLRLKDLSAGRKDLRL